MAIASPAMARARAKSARGTKPTGRSRRSTRAEIDDGAVVGARRTVDEFEIAAVLVTDEVIGEERVEDELARKAEEVERARPVFLQERAYRGPVLAGQELLFGLLAIRRVVMAAAELVDERLLAGLATAEAQRLEAAANFGVGVGDEPVGRLHDVGVGVVNDAVFDVRHAGPPRNPQHGSTVESAGLL